MRATRPAFVWLAGAVALGAAACAAAPPPSDRAATAPAPAVAAASASPAPARPRPLPEAFESEGWVVAFARAGDTAESLADRYLGDPAKAWMIADYTGASAFAPGQEVAFPRRPWNPAAVEPGGYQIVPVLSYHNLAPASKGRLVLAAAKFEEQMRYLKANGYRVVSLRDVVEWARLGRQLPQRAVALTFDDGYRSFMQYARPLLKEIGFTATLFVYTDYVGAGRNALSWQDLRELQGEGFDVEAHSKTHGDLRRAAGEGNAQYARRLAAELGQPQELFEKHLGRRSTIIAFPYGSWDESLLGKLGEYGYTAGFSVRRQGNASFVRLLAAHRSQVYSEMSLEDFVKNLNVYQQERLQ